MSTCSIRACYFQFCRFRPRFSAARTSCVSWRSSFPRQRHRVVTPAPAPGTPPAQLENQPPCTSSGHLLQRVVVKCQKLVRWRSSPKHNNNLILRLQPVPGLNLSILINNSDKISSRNNFTPVLLFGQFGYMGRRSSRTRRTGNDFPAEFEALTFEHRRKPV